MGDESVTVETGQTVVGADPENAVGVFAQTPDVGAREAVRGRVVVEVRAVVAGEPHAPRADPQPVLAIHEHATTVVRQPVLMV